MREGARSFSVRKVVFVVLLAALFSGCAVTQKRVKSGTVAMAHLQMALAVYYQETGAYPSEQ